ncbi:MAG: carbohydrate ABC transporter permease [Candidatus Latescibacteria bacterium]|jgi:ABC-type glycerol-3-phosphate transport system permease component|nr:carbohydrate ABC transporter permease [Candidatus Latescibacterota bacterium]MDP7448765.1 carbohydrate ABC transporter permease [Candidatus Latescibacterota bacterium]HJP32033.1 carbohydrate ABC transporter permease [Candidatus Latescibacterota bacterium]
MSDATHPRDLWRDAAWHALLIGLLVVFLGPFFWLVSTSFKTDTAMFRLPPQWWPQPLTFEHYRAVFGQFPFFRYLVNTMIIVGASTLGTLVSCSMAAYAFSRLHWPDRALFFGLVLATMMIPHQVTSIPLFILFSEVHWIDTFLPLTVPAFFGNAFFIFLLRQFFATLPEQLFEAARLDGAGEWQIFQRIVLPLSRPALLTVTIFSVLGAWNDFMGPLIYLTSESKRTLALGLAHLNGVQSTEWGLLMAAALIMTLPAALLFLVAQRFFIEGIAMTGTKA